MRKARVMVTGGRDWTDYDTVLEALDCLPAVLGTRRITIVHGAARGADDMARAAASVLGFEVDPFPAAWRVDGKFNKRAGLERNTEMARTNIDLCLAFWDGESTGTLHGMGQAIFFGASVIINTEGRVSPILLAARGARCA